MRRRVGLPLAIAWAAGAAVGAGCAHGGAAAPAQAAPPADEMAGTCAKLAAPEAALASERRLASLPAGEHRARPQAEHDLALAYYCLGLYAETLATLDPSGPRVWPLARRGQAIDETIAGADGNARTRDAYAPTLRLLVSLHRRLSGWTGPEDAVAAYKTSSYDDPALADVRDELAYMAGRAAYRAGDLPRAKDLLGRVSLTSPLYPRAKLREGALYVRQQAAKPAVAAFVEALRATYVFAVPDLDRLRDLAHISLARTFYSTGQYELAARYYARIPPESIYARERQFEQGWTDYVRGDYAAARRQVSALRAGTGAGAVAPDTMAEALLLDASAAAALGQDAEVTRMFAAFNATYPQLFTDLKAFAASSDEDAGLYARMAAVRGGGVRAPPAVAAALGRMLADGSVARAFDEVDELTRELAIHDRLPPAFRSSALGQTVFADLTVRRTAAIAEAGSLCRRRIGRTLEELGRVIKAAVFGPAEPFGHGEPLKS